MTEQNTGWQPKELRQLACDAVKHLKEERDALQARCDKLASLVRNEVLPALDATGVNISLAADLRAMIEESTR